MRIRWLLVAAFMAVAVHGADTPKTAEDVIEFSSAKMAGYKAWSAEVKQSMNMMGMPMTLDGQTWFKMPRFVRTEMKMPVIGSLGKITIVLGADGMMWQEMDMLGQKKVMKMDMSQLSSNLAAQTGQKMDFIQNPDPTRQWENSQQFMKFTFAPGTTIENQPMWVLEGTPKTDAVTNAAAGAQVAQMGKLRLYVGQQDGFTHRIEQLDKTKNTVNVTMEFSKIKFNEKLADSMFQYKPPSGIEVMDITDMSAQMLQQGGMPTMSTP